MTDAAASPLAQPGPTRRILLGLVLIGVVGLLAELLLLEHWEDAWQWTPLVLLVLALVTTSLVAVRPSRGVVRAFQAVMLLCILAGVLGVFLHYRGNVEFELERDSALHGFALFWESVRGATPALAPGALAQLGLLGLATAYRHPALAPSLPRDGASRATARATSSETIP